MFDDPSRQICPTASRRGRLGAAATLAVSLTVLLLAASLEPDLAGVGTHRQLGLPACGFRQVSGLPCATCGYTTAFAHAANGNLMAALITQPAGALLAVTTSVVALVSAYAMFSGASLRPLTHALWRPKGLWIAAATFLGGWLYKILVVTGTS